nr:hypothetical protein [Actinomycetota bacterium]
EEGRLSWAALLAATSLFFLYLAVRPVLPGRLGGGAAVTGPEPPRPVADAELEEAREFHRQRASGWRRVVLLGLVLSAAGLFLFPPMSLLVSALTLYALVQYRRSRRVLDRLTSPPV